MIHSLNMTFPIGSSGKILHISRGALYWMAASPLAGWLVYFLLSFRNDAIDRLMMFLFVFPFGAHLLLPLLFHAQTEHRRFMLASPVRFYAVPIFLAVWMVYLAFHWISAAAVILAVASGFHIGMQHYGLMRLIDRKIKAAEVTPRQKSVEKIVFLIAAILPTVVFSLKITNYWNAFSQSVSVLVAAAGFAGLSTLTWIRARKDPAFRIAAMWSFALLAVPWAFYYRFDFNEGAFLIAGIGHSLQYFICYRLTLAGQSESANPPPVRRLRLWFLALVAVILAFEWLAFENIQRNVLTGLIWALSIAHIYYDSLFWKNNGTQTQMHVMEPLYATLDRLEVR